MARDALEHLWQIGGLALKSAERLEFSVEMD